MPVPDDTADGVIERVSPRAYDELIARHPYRDGAVDEAVAQARRRSPAGRCGRCRSASR